MAVRAFYRAVLVRDASVVARWLHAVMVHQRRVACSEILLRIGVQVAERRRQTVAAALLRHAAERPQRILQALGQRDKTLATQNDVGVLEAGEREPEMVESVIEGHARDGDAERARVGEVGQPQPAGFVLLAEDHILLGAFERAPRSDAPLQRAADVGVELRMPPAQLGQHADCANAGRGLQDRHDLAVPVRREGIRPAPGYPACPDHTEKGTLFRVLEATPRTGIRLTESFAMVPTAAVSGYYFWRPEAQYFGVGKIERDQVESYARRKGVSQAEAERWLAPNLNYER